MFCIIYSFDVKPDKVKEFEKVWRDLTEVILEYSGSLGSRLHKQSINKYVAYAQWPNKSSWVDSNNKLPHSSKIISQKMKDCCNEINIVYELDLVEDLLK